MRLLIKKDFFDEGPRGTTLGTLMFYALLSAMGPLVYGVYILNSISECDIWYDTLPEIWDRIKPKFRRKK